MKSVLLAFVLLFSLVYASRASADECGGTLTKQTAVTGDSGEVIGVLSMYWNADNGYNCAVFHHAGWTWGRSLRTGVVISDCTGGPCVEKGRDDGLYPYRAGPVRAYGRGRCILAGGYIYTSSMKYTPPATSAGCG